MARLSSVFSIILFVVIAYTASAQTLTLEKQVIGSAGMVSQTNSAGFELSGILGQTAIEIVKSNSSNYDLHQGFWVWAEEDFVGVEENPSITQNLSNYPNPFSASTTISYNLLVPAYVTINVYNQAGSLVKVIAQNMFQNSGEQNLVWDGLDRSGITAASGSYMYEVIVNPVAVSGISGDASVMRNIMMIAR